MSAGERPHIDEGDLRSALASADLRVLLMVLVHLTGDRRWLEPPFQPVRDNRLFADDTAGLDPAVQDEIRDSIAAVILSSDLEPAIAKPSVDELLEMATVCMGEAIAPEYGPLMLEEMGFEPFVPPAPDGRPQPFEVIVIGAGVSGLCAAFRLRQAGIPFTVLERNTSVGGIWFENSYPDCRVDTPNHFYSFSFAPNHQWNHYYSPQREVHAYLQRCADDFAVRDRIRMGVTVEAMSWSEARQAWDVDYRTSAGVVERLTAPVVFMAAGHQNQPKLPNLPGIDEFEGPLFHSARWDHDVSIEGRRVGVVGSGASAMQIVPAIADVVAELTVFQRSPIWARPIPEYARRVTEGSKWLLEHLPFYSPWYRFTLFWRFGDALHRYLKVDPEWPHPTRSINRMNERHRLELTAYMEEQLGGDAALLAKSLPDYPPWGKRILADNGWFRTLIKPNVTLVTEPIVAVDATGISTADGARRDLDVIVFATGFRAADPLGAIDITGRRGQRLSAQWANDDPRAYLGMTAPNFPNLFMLFGPNTNLGHGGSLIFHAECQTRYVLELLERMREQSISSVEVRADVHDRYNAEVDAAHAEMIWTHKGMGNAYRNAAGRVVTNSPWRLVDYWAMTHDPALDDYVVTQARTP